MTDLSADDTRPPGYCAADVFARIWWRLARLAGDELRQTLDRIEQSADHRDFQTAISEHLDAASDDELGALEAWADPNTDLAQAILAAQAIDAWYEPLLLAPLHRLDEARVRVLRRLVSTDRLNTDSSYGQVVLKRPRWGYWSDRVAGDPPGMPPPAALFSALVCLPSHIPATDPDDPQAYRRLAFRLSHAPVGDDRGPLPGEALRIGFAPLAFSPEDLPIHLCCHDGREWYDVQAVDLSDRLDAAIAGLCRADVHVIVLPEMVLHPAAVERLASAIVKHGRGSALAFVVAGSTRTGDDLPRNRCLVLDHCGRELLRQDKLARWNLDQRLCEEFGLGPSLGDRLLYERISPGTDVSVLELPGFGRLAVLICEDLARSEPGRWLRANLMLDWQFTPVMDRSLSLGRWSDRDGQAAASGGAARVVVANSGSMTSMWQKACLKNGASPAAGDECGVALCIDRHDDRPRRIVRTIDPAERPGILFFDWLPHEWTAEV